MGQIDDNCGEPISGLPYNDVEIERRDEMDAYDHLPKAIRKAIATAPIEFQAYCIAESYLSGGLGMAEILDGISQINQQAIEMAYAERGMA